MLNEEFIQLFDMRNEDDAMEDFEGFLMKRFNKQMALFSATHVFKRISQKP